LEASLKTRKPLSPIALKAAGISGNDIFSSEGLGALLKEARGNF
jgi:hypothetical protein